MGFQGLNQVLGGMKGRYQSPDHRQFQKIQLYWEEVVGSAVANHAKPVALTKGVLRIATMSSAWAQNLVFERQRILKKLNQKLGEPGLSDLRFSTAQWQTQVQSPTNVNAELWDQHPSRLHALETPGLTPPTLKAQKQDPQKQDPQKQDLQKRDPQSRSDLVPSPQPQAVPSASTTPAEAFQQWAQRIQTQGRYLPHCPVCDCPTPVGELERWNICSLCAAKQWGPP